MRSVLLTDQANHIGVQRVAGAVEVLDEFDQPAFVLEVAAFAVPLVMEFDVDAAVEKREFLQTLVQHVEAVLGDAEDLVVGLEGRLGARLLGCATLQDGTRGHTSLVLLGPGEAIATDFGLGPLAQEVHDGHADTVQTTGRLVGSFLELAAELEDRHHALERADVAVEFFGQLFVLGDRNASTIVLDRDAAVGVHGHRDRLGETRHRFVDGVVDDLVDEVMQAAIGRVTDVHPRSFADMFEIRKVLQILLGVFRIGGGNRGDGRIAGGRFRIGSVAHEDLQTRRRK